MSAGQVGGRLVKGKVAVLVAGNLSWILPAGLLFFVILGVAGGSLDASSAAACPLSGTTASLTSAAPTVVAPRAVIAPAASSTAAPTSSSATTSSVATPTSSAIVPPTTTTFAGVTLTADQMTIAEDIAEVATAMNLTERDAAIGEMTGMDESTLTNLDHGDQAGPTSRGVFQQKPEYYPTVTFSDPKSEAQGFFTREATVANRATLAMYEVAHLVQGNQNATDYVKWQDFGTAVAAALYGQTTPVPCTPTTGDPIGPDATAQEYAAAMLALWGTTVTGNPGVLADLQATAAGTPIDNSSSCGHSVDVSRDLLRLLLRLTDQYKLDIWNIITGHGCDTFYHPTGYATDVGAVTDKATGQTTNFYPNTPGNNPAIVAAFIDDTVASAPNMLGMAQGQCADTQGANARYKAITWDTDVCTHQHINLEQGAPQWGPYPTEIWPGTSTTPTSTSPTPSPSPTP